MAQRRMFSLKIVDTDAFLDMPQSSQLLYFHLSMRADDDGFVSNPKKIMKIIGSQEDDYRILIAKKYILKFDSGVCVVKHWLIHNLIRHDRYTETQYIKEKEGLIIDEKTKKYILDDQNVIPNGNQSATQVRLGKDRIGKDRLKRDEIKKTPSQIAKDFFNNKENQEKVINELILKYPDSTKTIKEEIEKFIFYWTELNKSGTQQRWQKQPTFEVHRRLQTWLRNARDFNQNKSKTLIAV